MMVQDLWPGYPSGIVGRLVGVNGSVYVEGNDGVSGGELYRFPDIYPPAVWDAQFSLGAGNSPNLTFNFTEPVTGLSPSSLSMVNTATGLPVSGLSITYSFDTSSNTANFTLAQLPVGSYRATLIANGVTDPSGNALPANGVLDFSVNAISGSLFNDLNNNGLRDSGESGLSGWTVYLDANNNGRLDPGELTATTDSLGNYLFPAVAGGTYSIREVVGSGYAPTAPLGYAVNANVTGGRTQAGPAFGNVLISSVTMNLSYFLTVSRNFGQAGTIASGDLNGDGTVNLADLLLLTRNFGHALPSSTLAVAIVQQKPAGRAVRRP